MSESPLLRLVTLCSLYVAQGLPWGFISIAVAAALSARGLDAGAIAQLTVMATLPWSFKWIWGPVIDRFRLPAMGRRRPWILFAQTGMITVLIVLAAVPGFTADIQSLGYAVFLVNCFASLQDVSVDALAVDLLKPHERGRANGLMYGSSYAGNAVGGAVLGVVAARVSLQFAFLVLAIAVAAIMMIPLFLRERRGDRFLGLRAKITTEKVSDTPEDEGPSSMAEVMRDLVRAFSTIPTLAGVGLALLASMTTGLLAAFMPTLCIQELSWSQEEYAAITGSIAFVGLGGSIAGGFLADLVGPRRLAAIAGLLTAALWVVFALTPEYWSIRGSIITFMVLETILGSVFSVSLFALFMGVSWKRMAASQFTAYMAMLNLSRVIGAGLATKVKDDLNYSEIFLLAAVIITIAVMVLPLVSQARAQGIFRRWDRSL